MSKVANTVTKKLTDTITKMMLGKGIEQTPESDMEDVMITQDSPATGTHTPFNRRHQPEQLDTTVIPSQRHLTDKQKDIPQVKQTLDFPDSPHDKNNIESHTVT